MVSVWTPSGFGDITKFKTVVLVCLSGRPQVLGILPNLKQWCLSVCLSVWPPSGSGDITKFKTVVSVCLSVWPPSGSGDITKFKTVVSVSLSVWPTSGSGDITKFKTVVSVCLSGHPQVLGILPNLKQWCQSFCLKNQQCENVPFHPCH